MKTLLIDGDMLVHRSTVAVEKDTRFLDRYHILFSDAESAWNVLMETLGELQSSADTSEVLVTFSDPDENFRKGLVGGDYKSHRAGSRKPLAYWEIRKRVEDNFATVMAGTSIVLAVNNQYTNCFVNGSGREALRTKAGDSSWIAFHSSSAWDERWT